MNPSPVSIVISAYNAEKYIGATLDAVLSQTWPALEVIVVNDGSQDRTAEIVGSYAGRGVKLVSQENKGQDAALNNGYRHSTGSYIKFMDSDDLINPGMIEAQMNVLNGSEEKLAYGEWARFYDDKRDAADFTPLDYWKDAAPVDFLTSRPEGVMLQCGIFLIPRPLIEKAGGWDERLILFNDTEFFTRLILASKGVVFSRGARLYYRSGLTNSISAQRSRKFFESTFLATSLIAEQLLRVEDSYRVRNLISNSYMDQYYRMYPYFPDLIIAHKQKIGFYGHGNAKLDGGKVFKFLKAAVGWKIAKRIQLLVYKAGYKPGRVQKK